MKNKVRITRLTQNISQTELAERTGVSRQTIYSVEQGRYVPSTVLALKICSVLDKSVQDVFELERGDWETE
ncbi:MAG: transcriptional regulator [Saprospirales bacterium]|nr:MAG: transcriptional regulator [Saprospirales bacterium]